MTIDEKTLAEMRETAERAIKTVAEYRLKFGGGAHFITARFSVGAVLALLDERAALMKVLVSVERLGACHNEFLADAGDACSEWLDTVWAAADFARQVVVREEH